ncbi:unnamed protein product [Prorocentrum cordatum]|uniref:Uncharacterized protein n=1 Tax=Prorocentrum cordatum TaxID=2364126 RepID=A0ABN9XQH2_9DINO|nr:unnamed protein product [Polarella glacialis]
MEEMTSSNIPAERGCLTQGRPLGTHHGTTICGMGGTSPPSSQTTLQPLSTTSGWRHSKACRTTMHLTSLAQATKTSSTFSSLGSRSDPSPPSRSEDPKRAAAHGDTCLAMADSQKISFWPNAGVTSYQT